MPQFKNNIRKNAFSFSKQLGVGDKGEEVFLGRYASLGPVKSQDRSFDFLLNDSSKVELKTDTYEMDRTPNYFMEILSSIDEGKIGGPWRAMQDGADFFVYHYVNDKTFIWFRTVPLCNHLDTLIAGGSLSQREIRNKGWVTRGYLVPRDLLLPVEHKRDTF